MAAPVPIARDRVERARPMPDSLVRPSSFAVLVLTVACVARAGESAAGLPPDQPLGQLAWILAPAVLGVAFRATDPLLRGERPFRVRGVGGPVILAVLGAFCVVAAVTGLGLATGGLRAPTVSVDPAPVLALAAAAVVPSALEEVGWRGYLAPALLARTGYWRTVALAALVWFAWHLPFLDRLTLYTDEPMITLVPRLAVGVLALQVLFTEVWLATRSVWVAAALHGAFNVAAGGAFGAGLALAGRGWIVSPSADGPVLMALAAAAGLWLRRKRTRG